MFLRDRNRSKGIFYLIWGVALIATFGSLFFSEVMKQPPCVLCWYQRIAIYPLVLLIPVALLSNELVLFSKYIFTLAAAGLTVSIYHNLLYYGVIPTSITPCTEGISCTSRQIEWLGFITIPLLSSLAFLLIIVLLKVDRSRRP
ncbi:MAG: disulfide bond formation protein B [Proteobacteria bacterium]|nr:disulfide bond formation protein B [Pseudomonadota bacterium]